MKSRQRLVIAIAAVVLAGATAAVALAVALWPTDTPARYRGSQPPADVRLPSFVLPEWNGASVNSSRLQGKVVLVTFLETRCRAACPLIASQIGISLRRLSAEQRRQVYAIAVSTHPRDDTAASVQSFLRNHRASGELHYLIGSEGQLRPVWRAFHVLAALDSGDADTHSAPVRIFSRNGRWVSTLHASVDLTPGNLVHDLRLALRG